MTILPQVMRFGVGWAMVCLLLIAVSRANEDTKADKEKKGKAVECDREAAIAKIDAAIAKAVDPKLKLVFRKMRKCAERGDTELKFYRVLQ